MLRSAEDYNDITNRIIKCAIEVHRDLGPGLLESIYSVCLAEAMREEGLAVQLEVVLPVLYKGRSLGKNMVIDCIVEDAVIIELKAVEIVMPVHEAQLLTYLKLSGKKLGLIINFNVVLLKSGVKRRINGELNDAHQK